VKKSQRSLTKTKVKRKAASDKGGAARKPGRIPVRGAKRSKVKPRAAAEAASAGRPRSQADLTETRELAIARMRRALEMMVVEGIKTTIPLHRAIMEDENFQQGNFSTKFMEEFKYEVS